MDIDITTADLNKVMSENHLVALTLQNAALIRMVEERDKQLAGLTGMMVDAAKDAEARVEDKIGA